ncbi:hypothetical protein BAE44_0020662 [Dichanthelium oligosanthes]|uniref:Bifunctional inhibitor/plant lipid transfer protein/seed storage helical domain-containing protein n=1 Tax=Dichanthelium oligosanthes TaxID=888268 RepID=A0A1E5UZK3_9POAL|nr:hypothetical protein BAE44_0020662 [Dichanthelium oligosanthes]
MARLFLAFMVLLSVAMAAAAVRPAATTTDAPPTGNCDQDLQDLIASCGDYVKFPADPKIPPSSACCAVVQKVNIPCLCSKVTPTVETLICMDKVVYVANSCKRPLQPGSKCGIAMSIVGTQAGDDCESDLTSLISECKQYVMPPANQKIPPSGACCAVVQKVNVPCLCAKVTKEIEKVLSMEKVVFVAERCKRPFEHGYQCGSYKVPA